MATVTNFTANISGIVAYTNNSVAAFGAWYDGAQRATLTGSETAFRSVFNSKASQITALKALLSPATVTFTAPTTSSVVSAVQMVISGVVAYSDNTVGAFSFELRDTGTVTEHNSDAHTKFDNVVSVAAHKTIIKAMFDSLLTPTVATVTA